MIAECQGSSREYDGSCEDKERTVRGGVNPARCMTLCYTHIIIFYSSNNRQHYIVEMVMMGR